MCYKVNESKVNNNEIIEIEKALMVKCERLTFGPFLKGLATQFQGHSGVTQFMMTLRALDWPDNTFGKH